MTAVFFLMPGRKKKTPKKADEPLNKNPLALESEQAEAEKKRIMREMASRGGKKSVEVRRAKKAAKNAEKEVKEDELQS